MTTEAAPLPVGSPERVDKVIELVATSTTSWEHAAQVAVAEASKSIRYLERAKVVETDLALIETRPTYRIKLQLSFQIDRNRIDEAGIPMQVRRYLVVANQTLASPGLGQLLEEKLARFPSEFHVLVPQAVSTSLLIDPMTGLSGPAGQPFARDAEELAHSEASDRLDSFLVGYGDQASLSGEVALADPMTAIRAVMTRSSFDEIIISTQPVGISRWLKLDLPHRVERAFHLPVTTLVQDDTDTNGVGAR